MYAIQVLLARISSSYICAVFKATKNEEKNQQIVNAKRMDLTSECKEMGRKERKKNKFVFSHTKESNF